MTTKPAVQEIQITVGDLVVAMDAAQEVSRDQWLILALSYSGRLFIEAPITE
jgi:hypothetical protein